MIYVAKTEVSQEFVNFLEKSRKATLIFLRQSKNVSASYFEMVVFERMCEVAKGTEYEGKIKQSGPQAFPDITAGGYYGVEVKMTQSDHWSSTGNSLLESSRIPGVERIYIMFGKFGGKIDIRCRLYQECLSDVSVTHFPRYRINMNLPIGESIFDKLGLDYDSFRKDPYSIQKIKDYYRKQLRDGEELWWMDSSGDGKTVSPIIKSYRNLREDEKEKFILESMIFFPEIFGKTIAKFERVAAYLIAEYNAVSASLRDLFTAGGRIKLVVHQKFFLVPRLIFRLYQKAVKINKMIEIMDREKLKFYWREEKIDPYPIVQWKKKLDFHCAWRANIKASKIFDVGLREKNK